MTTQITIQGQVSYPCLVKPRKNQLNDKEEYSCDILIDKKTDIKKINDAINNAIIKKFGSDKSKYPKNLKNPIKDGDTKETPEYAGKYYITCKADASRGKIVLCDKMLRPIESEADLQAGDTVNANGNKGVSAGLLGVQLVEKTDNPFSGVARTAEGMFESLADENGTEEQNVEMFN